MHLFPFGQRILRTIRTTVGITVPQSFAFSLASGTYPEKDKIAKSPSWNTPIYLISFYLANPHSKKEALAFLSSYPVISNFICLCKASSIRTISRFKIRGCENMGWRGKVTRKGATQSVVGGDKHSERWHLWWPLTMFYQDQWYFRWTDNMGSSNVFFSSQVKLLLGQPFS